ncbi:hypothetical protein RHSIM_Rhsim10G0051800 [Rhododendron simsii]|uniref:SET domain-containing protein n=1 Tax=Rhododendron simsii TaxID=118357 RepID=A0A834GGH4_RHOSS|nr:hypothetical protein RHSIM_Rhsim10G0051800 [Rhododendron simsii]
MTLTCIPPSFKTSQENKTETPQSKAGRNPNAATPPHRNGGRDDATAQIQGSFSSEKNGMNPSEPILTSSHSAKNNLSTGEEEDNTLEVPDVSLFRPEAEESGFLDENLDMGRILLKILDVNSLVEDAVSSKVLGKNSGYHGVGLWLLPSFINHACNPNARRFHVGDYMMVHASRNIKAGEEITLPYFDVLSPLSNRRQMATTWGFDCCCKRCKFEEGVMGKQEMRDSARSLVIE